MLSVGPRRLLWWRNKILYAQFTEKYRKSKFQEQTNWSHIRNPFFSSVYLYNFRFYFIMKESNFFYCTYIPIGCKIIGSKTRTCRILIKVFLRSPYTLTSVSLHIASISIAIQISTCIWLSQYRYISISWYHRLYRGTETPIPLACNWYEYLHVSACRYVVVSCIALLRFTFFS